MKKKLPLFLALVCAAAMLLTACGSSKLTLTILDTEYALEDYAICVAKENADLTARMNEALKALQDDGTVDAIIGKYINGKEHSLTFQTDVAADAPVLTMATNPNFPPYEFYVNDKIVGIDAEIAAAMCDKMGCRLEIAPTEFGSIIGGVQTGKYDFGMAGMTVTDKRKESVDFTISYATGIQSVIVPEGGKVTSLDDLYAEGSTLIIGVQQDTTGDIYATGDFGEDRVLRYTYGADAVQALMTGKVDCVITDNEPAKNYIASFNAK